MVQDQRQIYIPLNINNCIVGKQLKLWTEITKVQVLLQSPLPITMTIHKIHVSNM